MIANEPSSYHSEGEAIASSIQTKLGPGYTVTYQENRWEIAIAQENLIAGSFRWTEQGWTRSLNPAIAHNVRRLIEVVVDRVLSEANERAIALSQEAR